MRGSYHASAGRPLALLAVSAAIAACGSGGVSYSIAIDPGPMSVEIGDTVTVAGSVTVEEDGSSFQQAPTWTIEEAWGEWGGQISDGGYMITLRAPWQPGSFTLRASATADPSVAATVTIEVTRPSDPPRPTWREGPAGGTTPLEWTPDGNTLLVGAPWGARLFDAGDLTPITPLLHVEGEPGLSQDGGEIAALRTHVRPIVRYDAATGVEIVGMRPDTPVPIIGGNGSRAEVGPQGELLVGGDGYVLRLDPRTGDDLGSFAVTPDGSSIVIADLALSPTGQALAVGRDADPSATVGAYYLGTQTLIADFDFSNGVENIPVSSTGHFRWSADGTQLFAVGFKGNVGDLFYGGVAKVFDVFNPTVDRFYVIDTPTREFIHAGDMSSDARHVALGTDSGIVALYDQSTPIWSIQMEAPIIALRYSPAEDRIAVVFGDRLALLDPADGSELLRAQRFSQRLTTISVGPELATAGIDGAFHTWDPATGATTRVIPMGTGVVNEVAWDPTATRLAIISGSTLRIYDTATETFTSFPVNEGVGLEMGTSVAWSADGARVVVGLQTITTLFDAATGARLVQTQCAHSGAGASFVSFVPDGTIVSAGRDQVLVCSAAAGTLLRMIDVGGVVQHGELVPGGTSIVVASMATPANPDPRSGIYDLASGSLTLDLGGEVIDAAVSPDGARIASVTPLGTLQVRNVPGGALVAERTLPFLPTEIVRVAWTLDGGVVTAGTEVVRWDIE